jgi:hypothetical protein
VESGEDVPKERRIKKRGIKRNFMFCKITSMLGRPGGKMGIEAPSLASFS